MSLAQLSDLIRLKDSYDLYIKEDGILYLEGEFIDRTVVTNDRNTRIINNPCFIRNFDTSLIETALTDYSTGKYNVKILLNIKNSFPKTSSLDFPDDCFYLFFQNYVSDENMNSGATDMFHISLKVNLKGTHVDCLTAGTYLLVADEIGSIYPFYEYSGGTIIGHCFDNATFELVYPKPKIWFGFLDRYNSLTTKYDDVLYLFESY